MSHVTQYGTITGLSRRLLSLVLVFPFKFVILLISIAFREFDHLEIYQSCTVILYSFGIPQYKRCIGGKERLNNMSFIQGFLVLCYGPPENDCHCNVISVVIITSKQYKVKQYALNNIQYFKINVLVDRPQQSSLINLSGACDLRETWKLDCGICLKYFSIKCFHQLLLLNSAANWLSRSNGIKHKLEILVAFTR